MAGIGQNSGIVPPPGGSKFPNGTVLTQDMGLLPIGTDISGLTTEEVLSLAYAGFIAPEFTDFSVNQGNVEVGTEISGVKIFSWVFDDAAKIVDNTISLVDVTDGTPLASNLSKVSPANADIGVIQKNQPRSRTWKATAQDTEGNTIDSPLYAMNWYWKRFWGFVDTQAPTDANIKAGSQELATGRAKSWNTGNPGGEAYFFYAYPASFGNIAGLTVNGFPSLAAFTLTTRDFVNALGVSESYNIYVSNNLLNASAPIIVT